MKAKYSLYAALPLTVLFAGCTDFLDIRTEATMPSSGMDYSKAENVFLPVSAAYASMRLGESEALNYMAVLEIVSDDADKGSAPDDGPAVKEFDDFTYGPENEHIGYVWGIFYRMVSAANYAVESMDKFQEALSSGDGLRQVAECRAEARLIRAFAYFNLVRCFGSVPLIDRTLSAEELASMDPAPVSRLYEFIYEDIDAAIAALPASYADMPGRYTCYTARALKAKVALYNKDWSEAARQADAIIASGDFSLMPKFRDPFSVTHENGPESLMEIQSSDMGQTSGAMPVCYYGFIQGPRNRASGSGGKDDETEDPTQKPDPKPDPEPEGPSVKTGAENLVIHLSFDKDDLIEVGEGITFKENKGQASITTGFIGKGWTNKSGNNATEAYSKFDVAAGSAFSKIENFSMSVWIKNVEALQPMKQYRFTLAQGECFGVSVQKPYTVIFTTGDDASQKFPTISDEALLDLVQEKTFGYFWDYAHPVSGLARERYGSGDTVTSGGSGFGIMALPVAVERGFITRAEAAARLRTILTFLSEKADRFHGVFPHWLNGTTGKVIPFSEKDNGGDLVETAFLMQGLLTVARFFDREDEADIRSAVDALWRAVEWDWYTRGGQDVLYWHWSPSDGWAMNMRITGWNEALIVYVLAASSPTHPVGKAAYDRGWASGGSMKPTVTGPLFFAHYSFLGLDPRKLRDAYADYWAQNVAHARYNYDYCVRNPGAHAGYGADCWGLTASDIPGGYTASSPTNDRGVIAPTAALASFPYTPQESLAALHTFYYILGDRLFGEYGFRDAFSLDQAWFASSYLAIDQGPIVVMIENYRSGLLWNLFMQDADIQRGLQALGFSF